MKSKVERLWPQSDRDRSDHSPHPPNVSGEIQQLEELKSSSEELKLSLNKAEKRINRLIGERTQLSSLLEKRDAKIDELNRELGRFLSSRLAGGDASELKRSPWTWIGQAVVAFSNQFRTFANLRLGSSRRESAISGPIDSEESSWTPIGARIGDGTDKQVVGVLLFGLGKDEIENLLPSIERDCVSKGLRPLLLVDVDAFEIFRAHELPFEYIPSQDQRVRFDPTLNWDLYLQRRLSIVRKKWNPAKLVAFGAQATETLKLWSMSPFEEVPLPDVAGSAASS